MLNLVDFRFAFSICMKGWCGLVWDNLRWLVCQA